MKVASGSVNNDSNQNAKAIKDYQKIISEQRDALNICKLNEDEYKLKLNSYDNLVAAQLENLKENLLKKSDSSTSRFEDKIESQLKETRREIEHNEERLMEHNIDASSSSYKAPNSLNLEQDARVLEAQVQFNSK
jgi:hypothetical protein